MQRPLLVLLPLVLAGGCAQTAPAVSAPRTDGLGELLVRARKAVGIERWKNAPGGIVAKGSCDALGVDGEFELHFDGRGRFRSEIRSRLALLQAWDGERGWERDWADLPRVLELEELDELRLDHWIVGSYWLDPEAPVEIAFAAEPAAEGHIALDVGLRERPMRMRVVLDAVSALPQTVTRRAEGGDVEWTYSDWRETPGPRLPHRMDVSEFDLLDDSFRIEGVSRAPAYAVSPFQPQLARPGSTRFDAAAPAAIEVEKTFTGHLLVRPKIDGKEVGWFILDSGAGAQCIDPQAAAKLELPAFGEVAAVGVAGTVAASFRSAKEFSIGPLSFPDPIFVELDLAFASIAFKKAIAGVCGYDVFARSVVELERETPFVAFHDPAKYELAAEAWSKLHLDDRLPCVEASFEGDHRGLFKLDTGANGTLIFHAPAVERLQLLEGRATNASTSAGVGGTAKARTGTLDWFELGGHRFELPQVDFSLATVGALTDRYTLGNIGGDFLGQFRIAFDYRNQRIAFLPLEER